MAMVHHFTTSARSNCIQKHQVKLSFYFPFFLTIFSAHSVFINGSLMFALNWAKWPEGMILLVAKFNPTFFLLKFALFFMCALCVLFAEIFILQTVDDTVRCSFNAMRMNSKFGNLIFSGETNLHVFTIDLLFRVQKYSSNIVRLAFNDSEPENLFIEQKTAHLANM